MAEGDVKWFGKVAANLMGGETAGEAKVVDFLSDTIKVMLTTSTFTPDQDTHEFKSDVTNEIAGTGYTAGGATLSTKTLGYTAGTNKLKIDADDVSWPNSTFTARWGVIYDDTPAAAGDKVLLGYVDFGADKSPSNAEFRINWHANGMLETTAA